MRKTAIAAILFGALLTVSALRLTDLRTWRTQILADGADRAGNLAFILSEYLRETFLSGDAALRQVAIHSRRIGGPAAGDDVWAPILASARAGLTGIGSISVVDRDGVIRHSTQPVIVGQSRRDQYVFRRLSAQAIDDIVIDTPFLSVVEPKAYLIPIGRRLTRDDGSFDGIVVATFTAATPRGFFRTVDVGARGLVWVFHPDGFVLFREPSGVNPLGESAKTNPIFTAAIQSREPGVVEAAVADGGPVLMTAYHRTETPPLVVAVSLDRDEELTAWRQQRMRSAVYFVIMVALVTATVIVAFRQMNAKARAEQTLRRAQQLEADRLREAHDQLAEALAMKDEFLMTVSHELRTPLTAIWGWVRMLKTGSLGDAQRQEALQTIDRNVQLQSRLVDDLLDVSRAIGGRLRLEPREVNVAEAIYEAVESIQPAADAKRIAIEVAIDAGTGTLTADPERLQQILWNLLSNAVKFTPHEGRVAVRAGARDGDVEIAVTDTGAGMSRDFVPHAFDRFRQEDAGTKRRYGGLGLGLAIVRHLAELHGGSVSAESEGEGHGSTFRVRLPRRAATVATVAAAGPGMAG